MGRTRFRKSFKVAPGVKINLNKKSMGVTVGGKGARYTVNTSGQRTASAGIPGTGLYFVETTKGGSKAKRSYSFDDSDYTESKSLYDEVNVHAVKTKKRAKNCPILGAVSAAAGLFFIYCEAYILGLALVILSVYIFKSLRRKYKTLAEAEEDKLYKLQQLLYGAESFKGSIPETEIIDSMVQKISLALSDLDELAPKLDKAKVPVDFFDSYNAAKIILDTLIPFEPYFNFPTSPSEVKETLYGEESTFCLDFVQNYYEKAEKKAQELVTEKGRQRRYQNLYETLIPYINDMDKVSRDYLKDKFIKNGIEIE